MEIREIRTNAENGFGVYPSCAIDAFQIAFFSKRPDAELFVSVKSGELRRAIRRLMRKKNIATADGNEISVGYLTLEDIEVLLAFVLNVNNETFDQKLLEGTRCR